MKAAMLNHEDRQSEGKDTDWIINAIKKENDEKLYQIVVIQRMKKKQKKKKKKKNLFEVMMSNVNTEYHAFMSR